MEHQDFLNAVNEKWEEIQALNNPVINSLIIQTSERAMFLVFSNGAFTARDILETEKHDKV